MMLAFFFSASDVSAQDSKAEQGTQGEAEAAIVADSLDRGTPRRSLAGFLTAAQHLDFETAAEYLDQRNLPEATESIGGAILAHGLSVVLSRELWVDLDEISDQSDGASGDDLPDYRDQFGEIELKTKVIPLYLQRIPRGDGEFIWKISNRTVADIPELYAEYGYGPIEDRLRKILPDTTFLSIELYKWVILIAGGLIAFPLLYLVLHLLSRLIVKQDSPVFDLVRRFLTRPFLWLLILIIENRVMTELGLGIEAQRMADAHTLNIAITTWALLSAANLLIAVLRNRLKDKGKKAAIVLLGPIGNAAKIILVIFSALLWLSNLGFNITALLAGLGVGGIAIALALQKPLEDLLGAVSLYTQQPAKIGDYGKFGEIEGTIEEIGLRATRIRTLRNTLVSVPNSRLAMDILDNYSVRDRIWYNPKITLRFDSTSEQLNTILSQTRDLLTKQEMVLEDPLRVRLTGFAERGLEISVHAYVSTADYAEFLGVAEELNLSIIDIVAKSGTDFAIPLMTSP
jgi:MscS family membrane protein